MLTCFFFTNNITFFADRSEKNEFMTEYDYVKAMQDKDKHFNVYEGTLNDLKVIYSAEIDGIKYDNNQNDIKIVDLNDLEYVEIKLWKGYKKSYLQYWIQCRLANVKYLLLGRYTTNGLVYGTEIKNVNELPQCCEVSTYDSYIFLL